MYCLEELSRNNILNYNSFSRPIYQEEFEKIGEDGSVCGAGVTFFNQPVGFAVAKEYKKGVWNISFLYVKPKYRKIGIGSSLLEYIEGLIIKKQGKKIAFKTYSTLLNENLINKMLIRCGFPSLVAEINFYKTEIEKLCSLNWIKRYVLSEALNKKSVFYRNFEIFRWTELNDQDRKFLTAGEGSVFPYEVTPLTGKIAAELSLGVRDNGILIGWLVTSREETDTLYVKASFLKEQYRGTSLYLVLFSTVMNLQKQAGIPYTTTDVRLDNKSMIRFMNHALADSDYIIKQGLGSVKDLSDVEV